MELIIDDLLSKVDEGIRRGFPLQGCRKIQRRTKGRLVPKQLTLFLERIEDAPHRCTTTKTRAMFSNDYNLAPNSGGSMDFKVCNCPSSNLNMEQFELPNQQLVTSQLLIFA
jgi:hypothetical protein